MIITKGQELNIKTPKGLIKGVVSDELELQGTRYWWIQLSLDNHHEVTIYEEKDLLEWNKSEKECDCGSKTLNHPGHSYWCSINEAR